MSSPSAAGPAACESSCDASMMALGGFLSPLLPLVGRLLGGGSGVVVPALVTCSCFPESVSATRGCSASCDIRLLRLVPAAECTSGVGLRLETGLLLPVRDRVARPPSILRPEILSLTIRDCRFGAARPLILRLPFAGVGRIRSLSLSEASMSSSLSSSYLIGFFATDRTLRPVRGLSSTASSASDS